MAESSEGTRASLGLADVAKHYLVAQFVVFLHLAGHIRSLTTVMNRYHFIWGRRHAVALVAGMMLLGVGAALVAWALRVLARRLARPWLERLLGHVFVVTVLSGLLATFPSVTLLGHPTLTKVAWLAGMAAIGYSLGQPRSRLVRYAFNACLVFSPAPFLLSPQILFWPCWEDRPRTELPRTSALGPQTPVFVFVFDEWSAKRSMCEGEFRPCLTNMRALCAQAATCHNALSPDRDTRQSIPRLIYQTDRDFSRHGGHTYWNMGGKKVDSTGVPSLFRLAHDRGYNTCMLGWYLPYSRILGDQVDYCRVYRCYPQGDTFLGEVAHVVLRSSRYWTDPISQRLRRTVAPPNYCAYRFRSNARFRRELLDLLGRCPNNTLGIFHLFPPHAPFLWNHDGSYRGPCSEIDLPSGYERNLRCADHLLGQIVQKLRDAGKFSDALLVVTSDHSWKSDPEPRDHEGPHWRRRVPLVIKLPGQTAPLAIDRPLCTNCLKPLFEAVFTGERDMQRLTDILQNLPASCSGP